MKTGQIALIPASKPIFAQASAYKDEVTAQELLDNGVQFGRRRLVCDVF